MSDHISTWVQNDYGVGEGDLGISCALLLHMMKEGMPPSSSL